MLLPLFLWQQFSLCLAVTQSDVYGVTGEAAIWPISACVPYLRFLLLSALVAVVWWLQTRASTIPLAGFMALLLAVYAVFKTAGIWN